MFVIREDADHFRVYLHPRYSVDASSKQETQVEGCLSVPGKRVPVSRATVILAEWLEFNPEGKLVARTELLEGLKARVFQHEHDHLQGISILNRQAKTR
jgi:peptide deformylase